MARTARWTAVLVGMPWLVVVTAGFEVTEDRVSKTLRVLMARTAAVMACFPVMAVGPTMTVVALIARGLMAVIVLAM